MAIKNAFKRSMKMIAQSKKVLVTTLLEKGNVATATDDTIAHYYPVNSTPDDWDFVEPNESFLILDTPKKFWIGENDWRAAIAVTPDGKVVVLSYPKNHNFLIV